MSRLVRKWSIDNPLGKKEVIYNLLGQKKSDQ